MKTPGVPMVPGKKKKANKKGRAKPGGGVRRGRSTPVHLGAHVERKGACCHRWSSARSAKEGADATREVRAHARLGFFPRGPLFGPVPAPLVATSPFVSGAD